MKLAVGVGESLVPLLGPNSIVEYDSTQKELGIGKLALYLGNRKTVCHMVLFHKWEGGIHWYFFKGNSILNVDGWIPEYRIVGAVDSINGVPITDKRARVRILNFYYRELFRYRLYQLCFQTRLTKFMANLIGVFGLKPGKVSSFYSRCTQVH